MILLSVAVLSVLLLSYVYIFKDSLSLGASCITYDIYAKIITVTCSTNLTSIYHAVNDNSVLEKDPHGIWILKAIIKVSPLANLTINRTDTSWLKITNKNGTQPNFISISGNARIDGVKITSWDSSHNNIIRQHTNASIPRPYILIDEGAGTVDVSNSEIAFLGYRSAPSNGFLYHHGGNGSSITNSSFHDMFDGFYSDYVGSITIKNNRYYDNLRYGIDPHTRSHDLSIIGNTAYNNTNIGIICSENCYNILFDNNTVHDNGHAGLMFSLDTNNSTAKKNYAYNEKVGISVFSSSNNRVYDNLMRSTHTGIQVTGSSLGNRIYNNTILNGTLGLVFGDNYPKNNLLENNNVNNTSDAIELKGIDNIGTNNSIYNK
jgi:poly(beta-D-mannuronate) C5 epimerase